jgi:hypothetical protein
MNPVLRLARRVGFGRNDLRRPVDRIDGLVTAFAVLATAAIIAAGVLFGIQLARQETAAAAEQQATRTATTAVLSQDNGSNGDSLVTARWTAPDGTVRTGAIRIFGQRHAGAVTEIWTDAAGSVVSPPIGLADIVLLVAVCVAGVWAVALLLLRGLVHLLRLPIQRWGERSWDADWARTAPRWKQWRR